MGGRMNPPSPTPNEDCQKRWLYGILDPFHERGVTLMIKQILFDCGGVLVELNFRQLMEEISGSAELADAFISRLWSPGSPWLRYDSGELNTAQVVEAAMKEYLPQEFHSALEAFVSRWLDVLPPMAGMEELVDQIQAHGLGCYVLSNFSEGFQQMPAKTPVLQKMDGMVISYETHLLKPDPEAYYNALNRYGLKAAETLFVDDNAHNVDAAIACGLEGYHFTTPDAFRTYLHDAGILSRETER